MMNCQVGGPPQRPVAKISWDQPFPHCHKVVALAGLWCATRGRCLRQEQILYCMLYLWKLCSAMSNLGAQSSQEYAKVYIFIYLIYIISKHAWLVQSMKVIHRDGSHHTTPLGYCWKGPYFQLRITSKRLE